MLRHQRYRVFAGELSSALWDTPALQKSSARLIGGSAPTVWVFLEEERGAATLRPHPRIVRGHRPRPAKLQCPAPDRRIRCDFVQEALGFDGLQ